MRRAAALVDAHARTGRRQHGAAVLMALFIAALAVLIVSGLFWNQFVLMRTIENQQLVTQSRLLLRGALDWSRAILREDQNRSNVDHLDEPWAKGLAETRLDQLGETSALAARAALSGSIEDAQSRFNLRNLIVQIDGRWTVQQSEAATLRRLCRVLDLPEAVADLVAGHLQRAFTVPSSPAEGAPSAPGPAAAPAPLTLVLPDDLRAVDGIDPQHAERLAAYVVVLDRPTPVNINTAREEVLAAVFPRMSLAEARALVAERDRSYFVQTGDARLTRFRDESGAPGDTQIAVNSSYFLVRGQVKLDRASTRLEALVRRFEQSQNRPLRVLWQREL